MRINLKNSLNTLYYGPLYVGTPSQEMQIIYDTGSDWLVIESSDCRTCLQNRYDNKKSSTWRNSSTGLSEHLYGSAQLYGYNVRDKVSLDKDGLTRVHQFMFFEIFKQYGLNENVDGIMGMSRKWDDSKYKTGPLYIEYLYLSGMI